MGFGTTLLNITLAPILLYPVIMTHVWIRILTGTPEQVNVHLPNELGKAEQEALIKRRQPLIKAVMGAMAGTYKNDPKQFYADWCTKDVEFEDPLHIVKGPDFLYFLDAGKRLVKSHEFKVFDENHGENEIVMDWSLKLHFTWGFTFGGNLRTHILLKAPETPGGQERIYRAYEEWGFNKQLNRNTTFAPIGWVHEQTRVATGKFVGFLFKQGVL